MMLYVLFGVCLILTQHSVRSAPAESSPETDEQKQIKASFGSFALKLADYVSDQQPNQNYVVSPINVQHALLLALTGSAGETRQELLKALGLEFAKDNLDTVHQSIGALLKSLQNSKLANISIADGVFVADQFKINDQYQQTVKTVYDAQVEALDFKAGGNKATDAINQFVSEHTHGRISKIYEEPIPSETVSVLVSALYFGAEWESQFPVPLTKKGTFNGQNGKQQVDFMENLHFIPYYQSDKYKTIAIPYKERELYLYVLVPNANETLESVGKSFTINDFQSIVQQTQDTFVDYTIPKFKLKYRKELNEVIRKFGVEKAFLPSADFSNLAENVRIDKIVHTTELDVTEFGTIGSAATSIGMVPTSLPLSFKVDRPFIFAIYHSKSAAVVFSGAIYNLV